MLNEITLQILDLPTLERIYKAQVKYIWNHAEAMDDAHRSLIDRITIANELHDMVDQSRIVLRQIQFMGDL